MHILGLPEFTLEQVTEYVEKYSAFLPILGKIKLPHTLYPDNAQIEHHIKIFAGQLGYLRLAEKKIAEEITRLLNLKKEKTADNKENQDLTDQLAALNTQKAYILSLNEQITLEACDYIYMNIVQPIEKNSDDKLKKSEDAKLASEISRLMHNNLLTKERSSYYPQGILVKNPHTSTFTDYQDKIKAFIIKQGYQSEKVQLPKDEKEYLKDFLQDAKSGRDSLFKL